MALMYILKLMRNNRLELLASSIRRRRERDVFQTIVTSVYLPDLTLGTHWFHT